MEKRIGLWSLIISISLFSFSMSSFVAPKTYQCSDNSCVLLPAYSSSGGQSQAACQLSCGGGNIWPFPNGEVKIGNSVSPVSLPQVRLGVESEMNKLLKIACRLFSNDIEAKKKHAIRTTTVLPLSVVVNIAVIDPSVISLDLDVDESYSLKISLNGNEILAQITAQSFFGSRHALETLSQLMVFDDIDQSLIMPNDVTIANDRPRFPYRGVMLDLSRHFLPISKIESTIRTLSYNKMNVLHMHLSDTASFPVLLERQPNVTYFGAYTEEQIYTLAQIRDLETFATANGVMLLPEVDGPAHVSAGYQWGEGAGRGKLVICDDPNGVGGDQWLYDSLEPPSGQLNLANQYVYEVIGDVFTDLASAFQTNNYFHVGGDEVIVGSDESWSSCYNNSVLGKPIIDYLKAAGLNRDDPESFYGLWQEYVRKSAALAVGAFSGNAVKADRKIKKLHIWGGGGMDEEGVVYNLMDGRDDLLTVLPPALFTIQVWDWSEDSIVPFLVRQGYDVILSNFDKVYLDCGNAGTFNTGSYWCQPYAEWQSIYEYVDRMVAVWGLSAEETTHILGSETLVWAEMIDETNVEQKLWPRTAALAESLWSAKDGAVPTRPRPPTPAASAALTALARAPARTTAAPGRPAKSPSSRMRRLEKARSRAKAQQAQQKKPAAVAPPAAEKTTPAPATVTITQPESIQARAAAAAVPGAVRATAFSGRPWFDADWRLHQWRNALVRRGVSAEALQPLWCQQRQPGACSVPDSVPPSPEPDPADPASASATGGDSAPFSFVLVGVVLGLVLACAMAAGLYLKFFRAKQETRVGGMHEKLLEK